MADEHDTADEYDSDVENSSGMSDSGVSNSTVDDSDFDGIHNNDTEDADFVESDMEYDVSFVFFDNSLHSDREGINGI